MKLNTPQLDQRDVARDEFRDAVDKYNAQAAAYNEIVDAAHTRLVNVFFELLEPAIAKLAEDAHRISGVARDSSWTRFIESLENEDFPRVQFPTEPIRARLVDDSIASEFENLPTDTEGDEHG